LAAVNAIGGLTSDFTNFKYFVNGVDSTTQGVDFVASYPLDLFGGKTSLNLVANWTETDITRGERLAGIEADGSAGLLQLEQGLPKYRGNISINHYQDKWSVSARLNYFGEYYDPHADDPTLPIYADAQVTFDTEVGYDLTDKLKISVGADNLFDSYPTSNPYATILGAKYSVSAPAGFNGGFYYLKLSYKH
jgi:iron complex outermembrane receptor protein